MIDHGRMDAGAQQKAMFSWCEIFLNHTGDMMRTSLLITGAPHRAAEAVLRAFDWALLHEDFMTMPTLARARQLVIGSAVGVARWSGRYEYLSVFHGGLSRLSLETRLAFVLRMILRMPSRESAAFLRIPVETLESRACEACVLLAEKVLDGPQTLVRGLQSVVAVAAEPTMGMRHSFSQ